MNAKEAKEWRHQRRRDEWRHWWKRAAFGGACGVVAGLCMALIGPVTGGVIAGLALAVDKILEDRRKAEGE